jgi:hypothetical protein
MKLPLIDILLSDAAALAGVIIGCTRRLPAVLRYNLPLVYTRNPDPYIESIVADLVEKGLIDDVNRFSFTLNAEGQR